MRFIQSFPTLNRRTAKPLFILVSLLVNFSLPWGTTTVNATSLDHIPLQAQYAISAAVGVDQDPYHAVETESGYKFENKAQNFSSVFTNEGVKLQNDDLAWNLGLQAWGMSESLFLISEAFPKADMNRVTYQHEGIIEWYVNGPGGLQQGFTVEHPLQNASKPLTLQLDLPENANAQINKDGTGLTIIGANEASLLTYSGLLAYDAANQTLPAHLEINQAQNSLYIIVDVKHAVYPITIDPWAQTAKLMASDQDFFDQFGWSVAISGDVAAIGANKDGNAAGGDSSAGSVYVFLKPAGGWTNTSTYAAKLTASDRAKFGEFGAALAMDGDTIVVGAYADESSTGSVYVFEKPTGGWSGHLTENAKLTASGAFAHIGDEFGYSVAINGDIIVVGAKEDAIPSGWGVGAAYVFSKPAGGWVNSTESARLISTGSMHDDKFGSAVGVSGDTVIVGAPRVDLNGSYSGSVYVFEKPVAGWSGERTPDAVLVPTDSAVYANFGCSIDIEGETVVAGAYGDTLQAGSAYIFEKGATWSNGAVDQTAKLSASDAAMLDEFGYAISMDNHLIAVGAKWDDDNGSNSGSVYLFEEPASGWADMTETTKVTSTDGAANDYLGHSISISGEIVVAGSPFSDPGYNNEGVAYIFEQPPAPEIDVQRPVGTTITTGSTDDLGAQLTGTHDLTYTVENSGTDDLTINPPVASGLSNVSNFSVTTAPSSPVLPGASTTFTIQFDVDTVGTFNLDISLANNDNNENPYNISIQGAGYQLLDFGDAPDPVYPVLLANNGARHILGSGVYLGSCVDNEADGQPTFNAAGDDAAAGTPVYGFCTSNNDEDGVSFPSALIIGTTADIIVTASSPCALSAWIDLNQDGSWADAGEEIFTNQLLAAGINPLSFPIPASAVAGDTYTRFRCTTDGAVSFTGSASDGEVEDYQVTISHDTAPIVLFDANTMPANGTTLFNGPTQISVSFSEDVKSDASPGAANTTDNYALLEAQGDGFNTTDCAAIASTGISPNDTAIPINLITYENHSGAGPFVATLNINNGQALQPGTYRLYICGTTSIEDLIGIELNDGLSDTHLNFTVSVPVTELPATGFVPHQIFPLPDQSLEAQYAEMGDLWLEIPSLGIKKKIVGVPQTSGGWDLTWLGNEIGYLNGTAFPTWVGNTALTGHAYNQLGQPGPFADLGKLWWGNNIDIHAWGMKYTYEVRSISWWTQPDDTSAITKHEDSDWITLVTCRGYNKITNRYRWRTVVRAVLVKTEKE